MERVLGGSGLSGIPGGRTRVSDFLVGRARSTVFFTVLDHSPRDVDD